MTGVAGWALITAFSEDVDVHPLALVTVNVYVLFAGKPLKLPVVPDPVIVVEPIDSVTVQASDDGNPLRATVAVAVPQVGCVIIPTTGADMVAATLTVTANLLGDSHPPSV